MTSQLILGSAGGARDVIDLPTTVNDYYEEQIGVVKVNGTTYTLKRRYQYIGGFPASGANQKGFDANLSGTMHNILSLGGMINNGTNWLSLEHPHYASSYVGTSQINIFYAKNVDLYYIGWGTAQNLSTFTGYIIVEYY